MSRIGLQRSLINAMNYVEEATQQLIEFRPDDKDIGILLEIKDKLMGISMDFS